MPKPLIGTVREDLEAVVTPIRPPEVVETKLKLTRCAAMPNPDVADLQPNDHVRALLSGRVDSVVMKEDDSARITRIVIVEVLDVELPK